ncbi:MAG: NAD(P)-binding domain-containing protein [Candidatus Binatia bacterium]
MTSRTIAAVTGALALGAGALLLSEHRAVSPGPLSQTHAELHENCRACHTPFAGTGAGCVACHGGLPARNKHADAGLSCDACHQEHQTAKLALVATAGEDCTSCHAHPSVSAVKLHRAALIERPLEREPHRLDFSHRFHFDEIQDAIDDGEVVGDTHDCVRCHLVGAAARKAAHAEQALSWNGCTPCHKDWKDAGLEDVPAGEAVVPFPRFIASARLFRVRFRHSPGHLRTACRECHVNVAEAEAIQTLRDKHGRGGEGKGTTAAKRTRNCFACHAHRGAGIPTAPSQTVVWRTGVALAAEPHLAACTDCHEFHGTGGRGDFTHDPLDNPRPASWDALARIGGFLVTPWLLGFVGFGGIGYIAVLRWLPGGQHEAVQADPDVAPQRVSEVPALSPSYESSIPGLYIVGELAGVPLINRAMKSGFDAVDFISNKLQVEGRAPEDRVVDVVIVGAGPAGLGAATRAKSLKLSYVVCEKGGAAATIRNYPRAKVIQTAPIDIPEYGTFFQEDDESKEALVRRWQDIIARTGLVIHERQELLGVTREASGLLVTTVQGDEHYRSRFVVLALGVRGTPRRLGVPGEVPERVAYGLIDAAEFCERRILVVGGGNAACEAALALAAPALLNEVTLSHRGPVLRDVTAQNSQAVDVAAREGQLRVEPDSQFKEIRPTSVLLATPSGPKEIPNDFIFALIGAELPTKLLRAIGVKLVKKGGL